jgi:hypothetical protein
MAELTGLATEEGSFIPTLTFGGASVGMDGAFDGWYTRIGRMVWFTIGIALTAKGSSTGTALIGGLPYNSHLSSAAFQYPIELSTANGAITSAANTHPVAGILAGTDDVRILSVTDATNALTVLTDTAFSNTSSFVVHGFYRVED